MVPRTWCPPMPVAWKAAMVAVGSTVQVPARTLTLAGRVFIEVSRGVVAGVMRPISAEGPSGA